MKIKSNKKVILSILISVVVLAVVFLGIYFIFKDNQGYKDDNNKNNELPVSTQLKGIKQIYPSKNGYTVLWNDGTTAIYYNYNDSILYTQISEVYGITKLIDGNRGISDNGEVYVWSTDKDAKGFAQAVKLEGFKNIVDVSGDYYVQKNNEDYTILKLDSNTEGALIETLFTVDSFKKIVTDELGGYILKSDGTVWAWGSNTEGQLATGSICTVDDNSHYSSFNCKCSEIPIKIYGLDNIKDIALRIAVDNEGNVYTWGINYYGTLGNGKICSAEYNEHYISEECNCEVLPYNITSINNAVKVYSNGSKCYAICSDGVYTWGECDISSSDEKIKLDTIPVKYDEIADISYISTIKNEKSMSAFVSESNIYLSGYNSLNNSYNSLPEIYNELGSYISVSVGEIDFSNTTEIYAGESVSMPNIEFIECINSDGEKIRLNVNGWYSKDVFTNCIYGEYIFYPAITAESKYFVSNIEEFAYKVTVSNEMPKSIEITPPNKTEYYIEESIETEGGIIKAVYLDGKTVEVPLSYAEINYDTSTVGECEVAVKIFGLESSFIVNIIDKSIISVSLNSLPNKTEYKIGENVNTDGGSLLVTYSTDEVECVYITENMIRNFNTKNVGIVTVTIDYMDYIFEYDIIVKEGVE